MTTPNQGGVRLPEEFVAVLMAFRLGDPRLAATLKATNEAGWSLASIAAPLGITYGRIGQLIKEGDGGEHGPIPPIPAAPPKKGRSDGASATPQISVADAAAYKEAIREAHAFRAARDKAIDEERAAKVTAAAKAEVADRKFKLLCERRFLKPIGNADDEGQRLYQCTKCRKRILRDATNPHSHRCY